MGASIKVVGAVQSNPDGSDTRVHLKPPIHPWELRISLRNQSISDAFRIREDDVSLVNRLEQLEFPIGYMRELVRLEDGIWETSFVPNLENVPEGVSVEITIQSERSQNPS